MAMPVSGNGNYYRTEILLQSTDSMANPRTRLFAVVCILSAVPTLAEKEKKIVTLLNEQLGKTEEQMTADWGPGIQQLPGGRKRLMIQKEPIFRSSPAHPGYTVSKPF
jgi:hypothetical protein